MAEVYEEQTKRLGRADYGAALVLALTLVGASALRIVPGVVGVFHDDAVYAITANALADGEGYRLTNLPAAPRQTKYPILYPAILSTAARATASPSARLAAMQTITIGLAAAAVALAYLYCVRFAVASRPAAFAGVLLAASSPNLLFYCVQTLSEMPFSMFLVAALWTGDLLLGERVRGVSRQIGAGVVLGLPFLCRVVGIVVPPVALALLALRRKPARWPALGALLAVAPWLAWVVYWHGAADAVVGYQTDYVGWWLGNEPLKFVAANLAKICAALPHIALEAVTRWLYEHDLYRKAAFVVFGAVVWAIVFVRSRSVALLPAVLAAYVAFVSLWPWAPDRFVIPVLPLVAIVAFEQLRRGSARFFGPRAAVAVVAAVCVVPVAMNLVLLTRYRTVSRTSGYPYFVPPDEPVEWTSYEQAFEWLRASTAPNDVLAAGFDSMTALYSERPVIRPFVARPGVLFYGEEGPAIGTVAELDAILRKYKPRFLFVSPMPAFPEESAFYDLIADYVRAKPLALRLAYRGSDARFLIYEVREDG